MPGPFEEIAVREAKVFLNAVSEGLKSLAKGIETLAKQVDGFQVDGSGESAKDTSAAPKADATKKAKPPA